MNPITGVPTVVDYLLAVAAILGAIAWPTVLAIVLLAFRKPLREALEHLIEFRFGSTTVKFDRAAAGVGSSVVESLVEAQVRAEPGEEPTRPQLRDYYADLANENPLSAILKAYIAVEEWFDRTLTERGIENYDGTKKLGVRQMASIAVDRGLLPKSTLEQVEGLSIMRDLAAHRSGDEATTEQAREFLLLTDGVLYALDTELAKRDKRGSK